MFKYSPSHLSFLAMTLVVLGGLFLGEISSWAQQPAAQETLRQAKTQDASGTTSTEVKNLSNADLGDIRPVQKAAKPDLFSLSTTQQYFYTSNAFLTDATPQASSGYHGNYKLAFSPYSTYDWRPEINVQYNMFRYDVAQADFDNEILELKSPYYLTRDHAWLYTPSVDLNRYTSPRVTNGAFYKEVTYDNQISHAMKLKTDRPLYFITSYDLIYRQTDPGTFTRLDNVLTLSLNYELTPEVSLQPFIRPAAYSYLNNQNGTAENSRNDFNLSSGLSVSYRPIKYFKVDGSFYNVENFSSTQNNTYNAIVPAVSLTGNVSF